MARSQNLSVKSIRKSGVCGLGGHRPVGIKFITTGLIDEPKSANLGEYIANYVGMKKTRKTL